MLFSSKLVHSFWRENSNVVQITNEGLTYERNLPLLGCFLHFNFFSPILEILTTSNVRLEEKLSKLKRDSKDQDLVQQLADLGQKNTRLEAELKEAKAKLEQAMASSVMALPRVDQDPDLQRLQKENAHLKEQLTKSMMALVSSGKVTVASVDRGDTV